MIRAFRCNRPRQLSRDRSAVVVAPLRDDLISVHGKKLERGFGGIPRRDDHRDEVAGLEVFCVRVDLARAPANDRILAGYAPLLSAIASHGFVIVAANSTWTNTAPTDKVQLRALDYAKALNEDANSIFYQRLDMEKIGAMGHSQGAAATGNADDDPRVKAVIFWNSGTSNVKPFLNVSGERDVRPATPESMAMAVNAATQPGAYVFHRKVLETGGSSTGHLVLMMQPERVVDLAIAWWKWQLSGDTEAKKMFVGDDCGLCKTPDDFAYGHNSLLQ